MLLDIVREKVGNELDKNYHWEGVLLLGWGWGMVKYLG